MTTHVMTRLVAAVHTVKRRKGDAFDVGDDGARDIVRAVLEALKPPESDGDEAIAIATCLNHPLGVDEITAIETVEAWITEVLA